MLYPGPSADSGFAQEATLETVGRRPLSRLTRGNVEAGVVRNVSNRKPHPWRRLSDDQLAIAIKRRRAVCPLSADEITEWAGRLGCGGANSERRLQNLVTYWFDQASSFSGVLQATDEARVRDYVKRRLGRGEAPDAIALPPDFHRIDKWLPDLSGRLSAIRAELIDLPGDVNAALRVRFANYDEALDHLAALAVMLNTIAGVWHRPHPGQPSLERESRAVELLICAVEEFIGEEFPSPRSCKRDAELDFGRLLAGRLFPQATRAEIDTMLRLFHNRRLAKGKLGRASVRRRRL